MARPKGGALPVGVAQLRVTKLAVGVVVVASSAATAATAFKPGETLASARIAPHHTRPVVTVKV